MKLVRAWLNEAEFDKFSQQCEKLGESQYEFVKKAVRERMVATESLSDKANRWLWEDHKIVNTKKNVA